MKIFWILLLLLQCCGLLLGFLHPDLRPASTLSLSSTDFETRAFRIFYDVKTRAELRRQRKMKESNALASCCPKCQSFMSGLILYFLLACGDVEANPGPFSKQALTDATQTEDFIR